MAGMRLLKGLIWPTGHQLNRSGLHVCLPTAEDIRKQTRMAKKNQPKYIYPYIYIHIHISIYLCICVIVWGFLVSELTEQRDYVKSVISSHLVGHFIQVSF